MDEILRLQVRAIGDFVTRRSIAIILKPATGGPSIGSATCVRVGSHYLLSTAAHVIAEVEDAAIDLRAASELSTARIPFNGRSVRPGQPTPDSDVAWIELSPDTVDDHRLQFIDLRDLHSVPGQTRNDPFITQGYPSASVEGDRENARHLDLESQLALTMAAESHALPRPLREFEFAIEYPPRDAQDQPMKAPDPFGMSGGGTWRQPRHDAAILWTPDTLWLVGVNTLWSPRSKVLYCTKVDTWLELVAQDFPDTAPLVAGFLRDRPW